MNISVPIYIESVPQEGQSAPIYSVRPLFFQWPVGRDEDLQRAISKFVRFMRRQLDSDGRGMRHHGLAAHSFQPQLEEHLLSFSLDLKIRTVRCKFLFVVLNRFDRRIAFTPSLPQLWFE